MNITDWFTGVVEDTADPLQQGRVRVRCFNYHTPSQSDLPTQDLPWSTCLMPVTSPSISGVGQSPTGLMPGSWVFGVFRDGAEKQDPFVLGSIPSAQSVLPGERGNGFADPAGTYPNALGSDIPAGATSYGYGSNASFTNQKSGAETFNNSAVGAGSSASTLHGVTPPATVNGNVSAIIAAARGEVGVTATSENQGPGIAKYWTATNYSGGYNARAHWCAAFVCWCIRQSGIFSESDRPKSASCYKAKDSFEQWARTKGSAVTLSVKPTNIRVGDVVIFSFSHIGVATSASDISGNFRTIEGNTNAAGSRNGIGVFEKTRNISVIRSAITINSPNK